MRLVPLFLILLGVSAGARAQGAWQSWISPEAFAAAAARIAHRVDLFTAIWNSDPDAVLYGGTSRDFLWFVRGEFARATSREDLAGRIRDLLERPIEIREFLTGQSDLDVISYAPLATLPFDDGVLTKIEVISPEWFRPGDPRFTQEAEQGFCPVEKIRLTRHGFARIPGLEQGDGVREIYEGRPSVHFDPRIVGTPLYTAHGNHPLLLAIRYLRQVATSYYRRAGHEFPRAPDLEALMPAESKAAVVAILEALRRNPDALQPFLQSRDFTRRLNRALAKAFRSYTNPTAAKILFEMFGLDRLLEVYGPAVERYHTLMYQKYRRPLDLERQRGTLTARGYLTTVGDYFAAQGVEAEADGALVVYHGTPSMEAYRNIVFQGNIPSETGLAGEGVYAVDGRSRAFADRWRKQHPTPLVVRLALAPASTLVDTTTGLGQAAWQEFKARHPDRDETAFADFVGADVLRYPYEATFAYVIKNGAAILGQTGVTIPLMNVADARRDIQAHANPVARFREIALFDPSLFSHWNFLLSGLGTPDTMIELLSERKLQTVFALDLVKNPAWRGEPELALKAFESLLQNGAHAEVETVVRGTGALPEPLRSRILLRALDGERPSHVYAVKREVAACRQWSAPMWEVVYRLLPRSEAADEMRKLVIERAADAPDSLRERPLWQRAEHAAAIWIEWEKNWAQEIPTDQDAAFAIAVRRHLDVSPEEISAGTALAKARHGIGLSAVDALTAIRVLGLHVEEFGKFSPEVQALTLGALHAAHAPAAGSDHGAQWTKILRERLLTSLSHPPPRQNVPGASHPLALIVRSLFSLPRFASQRAAEEAARERVRKILFDGALRREVWAEVVGVAYEVAPDLLSPEEWSALIQPAYADALQKIELWYRVDLDRRGSPVEETFFQTYAMLPDAFRPRPLAEIFEALRARSEAHQSIAFDAIARAGHWTADTQDFAMDVFTGATDFGALALRMQVLVQHPRPAPARRPPTKFVALVRGAETEYRLADTQDLYAADKAVIRRAVRDFLGLTREEIQIALPLHFLRTGQTPSPLSLLAHTRQLLPDLRVADLLQLPLRQRVLALLRLQLAEPEAGTDLEWDAAFRTVRDDLRRHVSTAVNPAYIEVALAALPLKYRNEKSCAGTLDKLH